MSLKYTKVLLYAGVVLVVLSAIDLALAGESSFPTDLVLDHVVITKSCRSELPRGCQKILQALQSGAFSIIPPTRTAASRNQNLLNDVFPGCAIAPSSSRNGMWGPRDTEDPLYVSAEKTGQYIPFGPFQLFEIHSNRSTVRIIAATGFMSPGADLTEGLRDAHYFMISPRKLCTPYELGAVGAFSARDQSIYWSGLMSINNIPYLVTLQQYCPGCDHVHVQVIPIPRTASPRSRGLATAFSIRSSR